MKLAKRRMDQRRLGALARLKKAKYTEKKGRTREEWEANRQEQIDILEDRTRSLNAITSK
tara:strand:- start:409 stop:588 length:180 start_codon:yes stop_codon:yes gene_type:complete